MIKIKQINSEYVHPVNFQVGGDDKRPIKGSNLFDELYANIYICAKKKSGKTTVLNKVVKECSTNETTVLTFCSTLDKDKNRLSIKQFCKNKGIAYVGYTSMKDENVDVIDTLIAKLQEDAKAEQEPESDEEEEEIPSLIMFDSSESEEDEEAPKRRKNKFRAPEYIIILDDLKNELKSKVLIKLLKMNRHYKMKVIVSSQYANDLLPESIKQMDYCLVFKGEPESKLLKLHKELDLSIDFEIFKKIYYNATSQKYNFLYIDVRNDPYRRNFSHKYMIPEKLI